MFLSGEPNNLSQYVYDIFVPLKKTRTNAIWIINDYFGNTSAWKQSGRLEQVAHA